MSWEDRTPQQRAGLKERRAARRERRAGNETRLWMSKEQQATTAADRAALAWDAARKQVKRIPEGPGRDSEWERLTGLLNDFRGDGR